MSPETFSPTQHTVTVLHAEEEHLTGMTAREYLELSTKDVQTKEK